MKTLLILTVAGFLGATHAALGQASKASPAQPQVMGRGRGGAPFAWNDKDKDGLCDITGRPVGQGRAAAGMRGGGRSRGAGMGRGRGMGAGMGWCMAARQNTAPAPPAK